EAVLALLRVSPDGEERLLSLINLGASQTAFSLELPAEAAGAGTWRDLVQPGEAREKNGALELDLKPYQVMWLRPQGEPGAPA
ncbi:MAG: alpha-glucosidase C-terminal domain-containing protein, partial [Proteobacteria bacterium]|nr:alpha-glucosidase C-terminal domain-containing protein [Pseudomonadota bacterium]